MLVVRTLLAILIPILAALAGLPQAHAQGSSQAQEMTVLEAQSEDGHKVQIGILQKENVTGSAVEAALATIPQDKDLIFSTDSVNGSQKLFSQMKKKTGKGLRQLLPLGPLKNHLADTWRISKEDKFISFSIVTVNTAYNSFIWLHATQYSTEVRAAQVAFAVFTSVLFLNPDTWPNLSRKLQGKFLNVFSAAGLEKMGSSKWGKFTTLFGANMAMSTAAYGTNFAILSYDHAVNLPFLMLGAGSAMSLAAINTWNSMGWGEFTVDVDSKKHPYAKFLLRRMANARSLLTGHTSPSSKLLQPEVYGMQPWIVMLVNGAVGFVALAKAEQIVDILEKGGRKVMEAKPVQALALFTEKTIAFVKPPPAVLSCKRIYR